METKKAIAAFLTSRQARNLRPKTVVFYRWGLSYLPQDLVLPSTIEDLELVMAQANKHLMSESAHDLWRVLRIFHKWLARRYHLWCEPGRHPLHPHPMQEIDAPIRPPRLPKTHTTEQISRLLKHGCRSRRDRLMVLLPLDNGIRLGELAAISKDDISPDTMRIQGKRGIREVPLSKELLHDLLLEGTAHHPWISFRRSRQVLTEAGVRLAYERIFDRADVHGGPHTLRHTFAYRYIMNGGDVFTLQRILGHRRVSTTEIYVTMQTRDLVEQHRRFSPAQEFITAEWRLL